ncbi:protein eiger isoform X1 [Apis laboriosa]|uniref:protein eiger isoform X1 n=1 Tax=Apis laboriosa TaxID=183418 RepID=UPI001CC7DA7A|nr:protein eiger isoform X1 [Apis laboriosa]
MTSIFPEEESKVARIKQKLMNDVHIKEETRSFLSFSRENLSISQSDLEQGYNKQRFRPKRNTILSVTALLIAFLCLALECWEFHYSLINAREIEDLKRSVDSLKHRILEEDLLDEVKAFEEQVMLFYSLLYTDDDNDDDDDDDDDAEEVNINKTDYFNYDEDTFSLQDYTPIFGARPSDFPDSSTIAPVPSPPDPPIADKTLVKLIPTTRRIGSKQSEESKKNHDNSNRDRSQDKNNLEEEMENQKNDTKRKRDVLDASDNTKDFLSDWKITLKHKRSIDQKNQNSKRLLVNRHLLKNHTKRTIASDSTSREMLKEKSVQEEQNMSVVSSRHPSKKYYIHSSLDTTVASSMPRDESNVQVVTNRIKKVPRKFRKNTTHSRKIIAVHYDGNKNGYSEKDIYAGNGRIRHGNSMFKAWKPSDWVNNLGMNEYFKMSNDGSVTIYEPGLYLVYAQIHYNDDHDEIGFHLQVNNQPILQCMIDNSGHARNISQTCFSAQVTLLRKEDVLVFKEASSPRFAIFDKENSFFGLVKLGELGKHLN